MQTKSIHQTLTKTMNNNRLLKYGIIGTSMAGAILLSSCDDNGSNNDSETTSAPKSTKNITLDINGLEDLGPNFAYEGWLIVDGVPVSAGVFSVNGGALNQTNFNLNKDDVDNATAYVLTIEPVPDADPAPSDVHILAGNFSGNNAALSVDHPSAVTTDFSSAAGSFILATPTDTDNTNELSGVWFLDPTAGPGPSLTLPTLPAAWEYEGWAVINGVPVSTGKFKTPIGADDNNTFSGPNGGPPFPGEDFLTNAPDGLTFPVDLSEDTIVISVEPIPDNSDAPFALKPLVGQAPSGAATGTSYNLNNNAAATNPSGSVSR